MQWYDFLIFIVIDSIIHYFLVKWEVKTNKDLFIDLELGPKYRKKTKNYMNGEKIWVKLM